MADFFTNLLGAGLGALGSSGSSTTSQNRDPWAPAQPWLIHNLGLGKSLQDQYMANPFSDAQKTAYNNSAGLGNQFRANLPSIFSNMGQQGYTRQNPVSSFKPYNFQAPKSASIGGLVGNGSSVSGANYKPDAAVKGLIGDAQDRAAGKGSAVVPSGGSGGGTLPFDTGPIAAFLGSLGFTKASDYLASQNDGYSPLSGADGYSDPRDAAAKGLGVANTAPVGVTTPQVTVVKAMNGEFGPYYQLSDGRYVDTLPAGVTYTPPASSSGGSGNFSRPSDFGLNWGGSFNSGGFGSDASA